MNLKFETFQVNPDDPFGNDLLNRKGEIENLSSLIYNVNSPAVLAIDSPWGTGKTTFIKIWEAYLKKEKIGSLYFNAWTTDFSDDPLISFLGEMNEGIDEIIGSSTDSKKAWSKTKAVGRQIAKRGLPALIKIGTAGVIDADKLIEDEISKVMEGLTGDALDNYLTQKNAISDFHDSLSELIQLSPDDKPIVIFVDELDRCRPTYAISLLERVKHLFDIKGLIFVLSLDKSQLSHSVRAVYGEGIDSIAYLRRFIDFEYQLKHPELSAYIESLFNALSLNEYFDARKQYREFKNEKRDLLDVFLMLAKYQDLSLREVEQLLASINLALRTAKDNEFVHPLLLAFLVVTKNKRPEVYRQYISKSFSDAPTIEAIKYLHEIVPEESRYDCHECRVIEGLLISAKLDRITEIDSIPLAQHKAIIEDDSSDRLVRSYSDVVVHVATHPGGLGRRIDLSVLAERIEMLSQFRFSSS